MPSITLVGALVVVMSLPANADEKLHFYKSPSQIVAELLTRKPRVVAFGEYHQIEGGAAVPSAVKRFGDEMLASVAPAASDLVLETWVTEGKCGAVETSAVAKVDETIQRPETTEDELVTLLKRTKAAGVQPHILTLSCKEYAQIQPKDGEIDYVKLLGVVTLHLQVGIEMALADAPKNKAVIVYGGALHNDVFPQKELAQFSFAKSVGKRVKGRYLEVDLYVPEYIAGDKKIIAEPWYPRWKAAQAAHPGETALWARSPSSYIVIFPITKYDNPSPSPRASQPTPPPEQPQHRQ
jgi:hypothetical protein